MSGSSSCGNNNSGISAAAGGERAVGSNSGCVGNSSSASGGGGGVNGGSSTSNSSSNGGGLDGWESRQHPQRERSSRADYRAERTTNSDVLRGAGNGYGTLAVPSGSSRPSYLTSSPSDSERNSHHQSGGHGRDDNVTTISANAGINDIVRKNSRNDRNDKGDRSRDAREERNRERECRSRNSAANDMNDANDATLFAQSEASSSSAHIYNDNASSTAMTISLPTDELERPGSPGEYPDYLT